jgi:hypothetical protein
MTGASPVPPSDIPIQGDRNPSSHLRLVHQGYCRVLFREHFKIFTDFEPEGTIIDNTPRNSMNIDLINSPRLITTMKSTKTAASAQIPFKLVIAGLSSRNFINNNYVEDNNSNLMEMSDIYNNDNNNSNIKKNNNSNKSNNNHKMNNNNNNSKSNKSNNNTNIMNISNIMNNTNNNSTNNNDDNSTNTTTTNNNNNNEGGPSNNLIDSTNLNNDIEKNDNDNSNIDNDTSLNDSDTTKRSITEISNSVRPAVMAYKATPLRKITMTDRQAILTKTDLVNNSLSTLELTDKCNIDSAFRECSLQKGIDIDAGYLSPSQREELINLSNYEPECIIGYQVGIMYIHVYIS